MEHDHLKGAQEMDARYHLAKLFGLMLTTEGAEHAWREHREQRDRLLRANRGVEPEAPAMDRSDHLKLALSIQQRMTAAGILPAEEIH